MTFILLLLLQFSILAQKDSTKSKNTPIYSLTDAKTKGTPTIRLRPTRFLVYKSLANSSNAKAQQEFSDATARSRDQVTQSNIIPIGILNADVEISDGKEKKKDFILMASPIQKDIFQANVQFQLSPKLLQSNLDNQIESIEISFDNGDNWTSYKYEEQLISYQFTKIGEQDIGFRINSKKGAYVTFATVDVKQLIRPSFVEPKRVSAPSVKGGRVAAGVNGAEYRIHMGCDGIFDKPIIIAEGFDVGQNFNLDDLTARYFDELRFYRNNGYDLVLVNYDNGRTWIQDNAQVLKAVINQVNSTKVGNNKLVVIGESMSGLVARYALKQMENDGQNHNVSHFVAFDTPMKGANVPPGLIKIRRWAPYAIFPLSNLLSLLNDVFDAYPTVRAIDEPAAKQMLLTQEGSTPAPEFFQFQTEINSLGYPSQNGIKNIALVNGALNGASQRRYVAQDVANGYNEIDQGEFNQGDKLLDFSIFLLVDVEAWTHTINTNSTIAYANSPISILTPPAYFSLVSSINYDRHPGGRQVSRTGSVYTSFSFVPTFSAIDYRGALNNNNDYYLNIRNFINGGNNQVTNSTLTPFAAIYGNDVNSLHVRPSFEEDAFRIFGERELNMVENGCIGCPAGSGGLNSTYFNNLSLTTNANTRTNIVTREIEFSSSEGRYTPFHGGLVINPPNISYASNISARWEGSVQAPITGTYTFNMRTDDGVRVWFDGVQKVNDWSNYPPKDHTFQVTLNAGERKNIKIEWYQSSGGYEAKFFWSLNGVQSIVPACFLFSTAAPVTDCNFAVTATANPTTTTCGGTSSLTAGCTGSGCSDVTYAWSGNSSSLSGSSVTATLPSTNGAVEYTLTASKAGCANKTAVTTVTVSGCNSGGSCTYTEGQFLFAWYGEDVYAHLCGTKKYVTTSATTGGTYKPRSWLEATSYAQASCFEQDDPRLAPGGCSGTNGGGTGTGTADLTEGGTASDDGANNPFNEGEAQAFDNSSNTKWLVFSSTGNIAYDFANEDAHIVTRYTVTSANDEPARDPKNWNLQGSNDGSSWTTINSQNNQSFSNRFEVKSYNVTNSTSYKRYRLNVTSNNGSAYLQIGEIQMFGGGSGTPPPPPPPPSGGCTFTDGQYLLDYNGETIQAKFCGSILYARATWGAWKHPNWLRGAGMNSTTADCFATSNPGCGALGRMSALSEEEPLGEINVYPNPTTGKVKIVFSLSKDENVWFNLYDTQGKSLDLKDYEGKAGRNIMEYDLQNFPAGAYFINIQRSEKREILKVIKID